MCGIIVIMIPHFYYKILHKKLSIVHKIILIFSLIIVNLNTISKIGHYRFDKRVCML